MNDERGRPEMKDDSLKPTLFVLREDRTLHRYDLETGQTFQSLFLSSDRKFVELRLNAHHPNVVIKSTKQTGFCHSDTCQHTTCNKTKLAFITFTHRPLKFEAHLEITQDIFGTNLYDAVISDGFLIVVSTDKKARLYSFDYILRHFFDQTYNIGESLKDGSVVGQAPSGFPLNVTIRHEPPVLFHVGCHDYDVGFSVFYPFLCVTTAKDYCYKVRACLQK